MQSFGTLSDGRQAHLHTLANANGFRVDVTDYGGSIVRLFARDRDGKADDVVLGFADVADYEARSPYFGCLVGRVGNRIANGRFTLDGATFTLATNNAPGGIPCHLHGGARGFDKALWRAARADRGGDAILVLTHTSPDGDEGFPGELATEVTYTVTARDELRIDYRATTTRATPVALTSHAYFNLRGEGDGTILDHELQIAAERFTPVDAGLIPTGELRPVAGTPFDFRRARRIGERIDADDLQIRCGGGYDHNFVLAEAPRALAHAATVADPASGRRLEVWTTEPGLQFYSGNFLDGSLVGKHGRPYPRRAGFCLETQHFPDAVHHPHFPSTILRPGDELRSTTVYRFAAPR